ncbi:MAG: hypothetical protein FWE04_03805 [Oscillospiraceae bacterium]|nr:hypothetical protein [Oscillospiraceae bacterium]
MRKINIGEQYQLVLLQSIMELGGSCAKSEALENIQNNAYWKMNDENDSFRNSRKSEQIWRNEFAQARRRLKDLKYIRGETRDVWDITPQASGYHKELSQRMVIEMYGTRFIFTEKFYNKISFEFAENIESEEDEQLIQNTFFEHFNLDKKEIKLKDIPKPKGNAAKIIGSRKIYTRNPVISQRALALADHLCEVDATHTSFIRRNADVLYMEPHHFIPMKETERFEVSLDRERNIICLCSNCHNLLHYGNKESVKKMLTFLFKKRKLALTKILGRQLSLEELFKIYQV